MIKALRKGDIAMVKYNCQDRSFLEGHKGYSTLVEYKKGDLCVVLSSTVSSTGMYETFTVFIKGRTARLLEAQLVKVEDEGC
jgi:hypothetical protein